MWCYRLVAPYTFERIELPDTSPECLADGQVLLRFRAAGICGSDLPGFRGAKGRLPGDTGPSAAEMDGFPIQAFGGGQLEHAVAAHHIDGAHLRHHVRGDLGDDLVETVLRPDRLRHDLAEAAQQ